jgi:PKD repeat protein
MTRLKTLLAGVALAGSLTAQTLVIPSVAIGADGNSSTGWPFDVAAARLLYIYDSSHFTSAGVTFPILINQISWRANGVNATWSGGTFPVQLDLSTSPIDHQVIDTVWDNNHGPDRATVFNGQLTVQPGSSTSGQPGPFYLTIQFSQPFLYDPTVGDLTIDTIHSGNTPANMPTLDAVTTAGVALARRVYSLTSPPAATATAWSGESAHALEFGYTPASGLYASFDADVTSGASPLAVNFTDTSFTSAPGGITSWAWDFENDGIVDSTAQNPSHVYTGCGSFDVALTVNDGVNPPSTIVRTALITTDQITADFTSQLVGPLTVLFTDTSDMPATSWAWDLDGDGLPDSNAQTPAWVYASTAPVNVTLTVTRNCSAPSTITKTIIPAQEITTNIVANNGGAASTIFFDVGVTNPLGVTISAFDSVTTSTNTPFTVDVYLKPGTANGFHATPAAWTLVGTASGTSNGTASQPSLANLAQPLHIPAGNYGIALFYTGIRPRYVTGGNSYANGDLSLDLTNGAAGVATTAFATTTLYQPRTWSGTLYYGTTNITSLAGYGFFAPGCAGTLGVSHLTGTPPVIGQTLSVTIDNLPLDAALMISGVSNTVSAFGPLPIDLTPLGMPGCQGRVSLDLSDFVVGAANTATWQLGIPNDVSLIGFLIYNQAFVLDPTANAFGFVTSDAAGMVVGL